MRTKYQSPTLVVTSLTMEDVITTSIEGTQSDFFGWVIGEGDLTE